MITSRKEAPRTNGTLAELQILREVLLNVMKQNKWENIILDIPEKNIHGKIELTVDEHDELTLDVQNFMTTP